MLEPSTRRFSLPIIESTQTVSVQSVGELQPMLGPAIRGIVAKRWKDSVCMHPLPERETKWKYCKGCEHNATCSYGQTFEPDIPIGLKLQGGHKDAPRPFIIQPDFPLPTQARLGQTFQIKLVSVGEDIARVDQFWSVFQGVFTDRKSGLGHDKVQLKLVADTRIETIEKIELPDPENSVMLPSVQIKLTSPLVILTKTYNDQKHLVTEPSVYDLIKSGLHTLGALFACNQNPLPPEIFTKLKELASEVGILKSRFRSWSQRRRSNRNKQEWDMDGIIGTATYGPISIELVNWLAAIGKLHTGTHRIFGAGGWQVNP